MILWVNATTLSLENQFISTTPVLLNSDSTIVEEVEYDGTMPDLSTPGIYRLSAEVFASPGECDSTISISFGPCSFSTVVNLNGEQVYRWGELNTAPTMTNFGAVVIDLPGFHEGANLLEFYFYSDGQSAPLPVIHIGNYKEMALEASHQTLFNLYFIQAIAVIALFAALFFFTFSAATKFHDRDVLYFAFFAFSITAGYAHFLMNSPISNDLLWFKISRIGYLFAPLFLFLFSSEFTKLLRSKKLRIILSIITLLLVTYFGMSENKAILNQRFEIFSILYIIPFLFLSFSLIVKRLHKKKSLSLWFILIGFIFFLVATFVDISFVVRHKDPYCWITPYGYFFLISSILVSVTLRYGDLFAKLVEAKSNLIQSNNELQQANEQIHKESNSRERFLKTVAHEFRTPLNGMVGALSLVTAENSLSEITKEYITIFRHSFYRFKLVVQNILDYQQLQDRSIELQVGIFSLEEMLKSISALYKGEAKSKNISFLVFVAGDPLPQYLMGDADRVSLVLNNILHNAIKFTQKGGVTLHSSYRDGVLTFAIADMAGGIGQGFESQAFKLFERAEKTSYTQLFDGVGIGLTITKNIVEAMNGNITFNSTDGKGTTFTVGIPLEKATLHQKKSSASILIVDDNSVNLVILRSQLAQFGYSIKEATNGKEAVEMCGEMKFDAVLMDIQMPIMDGMEATKEIHKVLPLLPIIGLSGNASREECLAVGMKDLLIKPVRALVLHETIGQYLL